MIGHHIRNERQIVLPKNHKNDFGWLYEQNRKFVQGEMKEPISRDEILENLRLVYGVTKLSPILRVTIGLLSFLMCIGMIYITVAWIRFNLEKGEMSFSEIFMTFFLSIVWGLGAILFARIALNLLVHRIAGLKKSWNLLIYEGKVLNARIDSQKLKPPDKQITYVFYNPYGKLVQGTYILFDNILFSPNEEIKVLYVNDKLHTLL